MNKAAPLALAALCCLAPTTAQEVRYAVEWSHGYTLGGEPMYRTELEAELRVRPVKPAKPATGSACEVRVVSLKIDMSGDDGDLKTQLDTSEARPGWLPEALTYTFDEKGKLVDAPKLEGRFAWVVGTLLPGPDGLHVRQRTGALELPLVHDLESAGSRLKRPAVLGLACTLNDSVGNARTTNCAGEQAHTVETIGRGEFKVEGMQVEVKIQGSYSTLDLAGWQTLEWSTQGKAEAYGKPLVLESTFKLTRK